MKISPSKLKDLITQHPQHAVLIAELAAGGPGVEALFEDEILARIGKSGAKPGSPAHHEAVDGGADAVAAFNAKVEEYRKAGIRQPFGHTIKNHPDLHAAFVSAENEAEAAKHPGRPF